MYFFYSKSQCVIQRHHKDSCSIIKIPGDGFCLIKLIIESMKSKDCRAIPSVGAFLEMITQNTDVTELILPTFF